MLCLMLLLIVGIILGKQGGHSHINACSCEELHFYQKVNCYDSNLQRFPELNSNVTILDMSANRLQRLEGGSQSLQWLLVLRLSKNQLHLVHKNAFHLMPNLLVLQLSNNNISNLHTNTFQSNHRLNWIDLSNNQIILPEPGPFLFSRSLKRIDLNSNRLGDIPTRTFEELRGLTYLSLANNELRTIPEKAVKILKAVTNFSLEDNPLTCDCQLVGAWMWGKSKLLQNEYVMCNMPLKLKSRPWERLDDLECTNESMALSPYVLYGITALLLVIALLTAVLVLRLLRRRRATKRRSVIAARRPTPVPVGEYIEIVAEKEPPQQHLYESVGENTVERYVSERARGSYLTPVEVNEGPIYVNVRGPPLPLRTPAQQEKSMNEPIAPAPPTPMRGTQRRCSIPLLDGCDFYEVVD